MILCTLIITTYDKVYYRQAPLPLSYPYNHNSRTVIDSSTGQPVSFCRCSGHGCDRCKGYGWR